MASPQKENGHTQISNELFEKIFSQGFIGSELSILLFIIRKTYGFNKKKDRISLSQFEKWTKISRPTVVLALKNLAHKKIIIKENGVFSVQKDWELWTSKGVLTEIGKGVLTHKRKKDTIKRHTSFPKGKVLPLKDKKSMKTINLLTGEYEDAVAPVKKKFEVLKLAYMFDELASKESGIEINNPRAYFIILNAMKQHKLTLDGVEKLFKDWFGKEKTKVEDKVKINFALSASNINSWKTENRD